MEFTLEVRNFRGLRRVEWTASGVCAIVGPNGSGKTTLIDVLHLLRDSMVYGFTRALEIHGGAYGLRHFSASPDEPVAFNVRVSSASWMFRPEVTLGLGGTKLPFWESLSDHQTVLFETKQAERVEHAFPSLNEEDRLLLRRFLESPPKDPPTAVLGLALFLGHCYHFRHYALTALRREGSPLGGELRLKPDGRNLFTVLLNWRNRREYSEHWNFVTRHTRACFPELLAEFSFPIAANIVSCEIQTPNGNTLTPALLPDGFLVTLLHLCAVASSEDNSAISIDEPENALHPFAIRRLVNACREWSDKHQVAVLLATHSPVLLDTFKELPEKVFVMEPGHEVLPVPLDKLKKRNWLAHFSLGDLYEHLKFGAPTGTDEE